MAESKNILFQKNIQQSSTLIDRITLLRQDCNIVPICPVCPLHSPGEDCQPAFWPVRGDPWPGEQVCKNCNEIGSSESISVTRWVHVL